MKLTDFNFNLPDELIAQYPIKNRSHSKLLALNKNNSNIMHKKFYEIIDFLKTGDCIILNNSKVMPARIYFKNNKLKMIEVLLLNKIKKNIWKCLVKPSKKVAINEILFIDENNYIKILEKKEYGICYIELFIQYDFNKFITKYGNIPLPHYIKQKHIDINRYQTIYSKKIGSVAAPTAGLHFDEILINKIKKLGINIAYVTLHVGLGTFRPVKCENILEHSMHSEYFELDKKNAHIINKTIKNNGKIFAVGSTTLRTLETIFKLKNSIQSYSGWTDIYIYPGFKFHVVDGLITNFHLPMSSLIILVSAFYSYGNIIDVYNIAINLKYKFFSFGDSMIIY